MRSRYEAWVHGLNSDWLISRQRFFGVPFPLWYRLGQDGQVRYDQPLLPDEARLPLDPSSEVPEGFTEAQRGQPGGFVGDPDVMDTWATSSLSPQIVGGWEDDPDLFQRVFPMDLRPQAHEIIRTWLFSTIVRSHLEHGVLPWKHAAISGWVTDPNRKKMSKSKGNALTPNDLLERYGADAVRFWAASARPGTDTVFEEGQMKIGRRLAIKLLNASRFVLPRVGSPGPVTHPLDRALLEKLAGLVEEVTASFEALDYARALQRTDAFFWSFCDDYVELVKSRAYGAAGEEGARSASTALGLALSTLLRLFAPLLPFVTEEAWSWWQEGSIHRAPWPDPAELRAASRGGDPALFEQAAAILGAIRKAKSDAGASLKARVERLRVAAPAGRHAALTSVADDLLQAGNVADLALEPGEALQVQVALEAQLPTSP
jgi:valyl-tRNA synthetase